MADGQGGTDLYLYDLESGTSRALRQSPDLAEYDEYDPSVDPMGSKIVFVAKNKSRDPEEYELTAYDIETGVSRAYLTSTYRIFSPAWSNDGESVAYVIERDGKLQIDIRDMGDGVNGSGTTKTIGFGSDPSWRVDDRAIFFNSRDTLADAAGELNTHELKTGINQSLRLRGDNFTNLSRGTSIAYTTPPYSRRNEAVWIIDANNRQMRLSSPGKTHRDTDPVHINGTKFVAFTRTEVVTGKSSIFVVERYAKDPVETLLFEASGNVYTQSLCEE